MIVQKIYKWKNYLYGMEVIVQMDEQGRIYIPSSIREKLKSKRYLLRIENNNLILIPISIEDKIKKLRGIIKVDRHLSLEEIEKKSLEESEKLIKKEL